MNFNPAPFSLCPAGTKSPKARSLDTPEGLGDRMRTAAFAEYQAIAAFTWAADHFTDGPNGLCEAWRAQIPDEERHYQMIIDRMAELGVGLADRPVATLLMDSLTDCATARDFCLYIVSAEERGRQAGERLCDYLLEKDPVTAGIFKQIVTEEVAHVALAETFFGWKPA